MESHEQHVITCLEDAKTTLISLLKDAHGTNFDKYLKTLSEVNYALKLYSNVYQPNYNSEIVYTTGFQV